MANLTDLKKGDKVVVLTLSLFGIQRKLATIKKCNQSYIHLDEYKTKFSPRTGIPWHDRLNDFVRIDKIVIPTEQDILNAEFYSLQEEIFSSLKRLGLGTQKYNSGFWDKNPEEETLIVLRKVMEVLNNN